MHLFVLVEIEPVIIEEKIFIKSSVYFHHVNVISRWKRVFPSVKQTLKHSVLRCFVPSLVEIKPMDLEKKVKM